MILQTSEEARIAREARNKPKVIVRRSEVTRGIMRAVVYPGPGTTLIETRSGAKLVLSREESLALRDLLCEQLGYDASGIADEEKPDLDLTTKEEENHG